ncbi:RNA polymerase sigma factor [Permianibacter fluminis]|uniref:RNA polymerase sigma factor n=1 Tax=Permianibacter fluminis TaxID=2738515 RepID=UPI001B7D9065|nr:RNA polymerase sigma factor [Permianibacter fluminis]
MRRGLTRDRNVQSGVAPADALQQQRRQLDQFLAGVERRALRIAEFSVRNRDDALEIVQDAMMKLAQSYGHVAASDWPPLFQRILQSRITDHFRRQKVRNRLFVWFSRNDDDDDYDPIAEAPDETLTNPLDRLTLEQGNSALVDAVGKLPERQRQAFLLRHWEGLSEKETAFAMECSEGSVKTHLSRAMHALRASLVEHKLS